MKRSLVVLLAVLAVSVMVWVGSGVPSPPESQGVTQRLSIPAEVWENQDRLDEAHAKLRSAGFGGAGMILAGVYVDDATATIYVGLTEMADKYTAPIEAIVGQVEGVNVEFFEARFTETELRGLQIRVEESFLAVSSADMTTLYCMENPDDRDRLRSEFKSMTARRLAEHGVPLTLVGVDIRSNGLLIGLTEISPEYVAAIRKVVGDEVPIEFMEGEPEPLNTGRERPLQGGIQLETIEGIYVQQSTLSFQATRDGVLGFVMTGHAGEVGYEVWQPYEHGNNYVGTISANPTGARYGDAAFVPSSHMDPNLELGRVWEDRDVFNWEPSYETNLGDDVMMEGAASGHTSGEIYQLHVTVCYRDSGQRLYGQVLATFDCTHGDSGGTVFCIDGGGNTIVLGNLSGGMSDDDDDYAIYSPMEGIVFDLELDAEFLVQGVTGTVFDSDSGYPLQGAEVLVQGIDYVVYSGPDGSYRVLLGPGNYSLTADFPPFYEERTRSTKVLPGEFAELNFFLPPAEPEDPEDPPPPPVIPI
jgi:hypothetical protein